MLAEFGLEPGQEPRTESGAEHGVAAPGWSVELGAVTPLACRFVSDVFRERFHLVCRFGYLDGTGLHALAVTVDVAFAGVITGIELIEGRFAKACGGRRAMEHLGRVWKKYGPPEPAGLEAGRLIEGSQREAYLSALARLGR